MPTLGPARKPHKGCSIAAGVAALVMSACSPDIVSPRLPTFAPTADLSAIPLANSTLVTLPTGSYGCGRAMAINLFGVEGGHVFTCGSPGQVKAALWINGALVVLPSLPKGQISNVTSVASDTEAVGFAVDSLGVAHAASWQNGVLTLLPGGQSSTAASIGPDGVIAGSIVSAGVRLPANWVNGVLVSDAQPAGYVGARFNARAVGTDAGTALNPVNGVVRGVRAFRWLGPGNYQFLTLPASTSTIALGQMNVGGAVVGMASGASGAVCAYWPAGSTTPTAVSFPVTATTGDLRVINKSNVLAGSLTRVHPVQTVPVTYDPGSGTWARLPTSDPYGVVYASNEVGAWAGSIGNPNAQPVMWTAPP
ncbi:MAG: hypothetical protein ACR2OG_01610 [Gemmatimonadaceae bacterium]